MSNNAQEILDTILSRLKSLATTETVVGAPVEVGGVTVLPVVKVSVGFAAGAGEGSGGDAKGAGKGVGGGGGGGASVTPVGFITFDGAEVKFIPVGRGKLDSLLDSVPDIIRKFSFGKGKKGKEPSAADKEEDKA